MKHEGNYDKGTVTKLPSIVQSFKVFTEMVTYPVIFDICILPMSNIITRQFLALHPLSPKTGLRCTQTKFSSDRIDLCLRCRNELFNCKKMYVDEDACRYEYLSLLLSKRIFSFCL